MIIFVSSVGSPDAKSNLKDHPALNEAYAKFGNQLEIVDVIFWIPIMNPINDDVKKSTADGNEGEDVECAEWHSLISPLLDQDRPSVNEHHQHQKGVQSEEQVVFDCVEHKLLFSKPS